LNHNRFKGFNMFSDRHLELQDVWRLRPIVFPIFVI
jgi:hypothetical protein